MSDLIDRQGSDLISRQAAIDALHEVSEHYTDKGREWHPHVNFMVEAIEALPSAQRTGRWIDDELICKARCSVCGEEFSWMDNDMDRFLFCPNCGCAMEGEEE